MNLGFSEILIILAITLLFFGPGRLPGLGKSLGEAIRGFKKGMEEPETEEKQNKVPKEQAETESTTPINTTTREKDRVDS